MASKGPSPEALHKALAVIRDELERVTQASIPGKERLSAGLALLHLSRAINVVKAILLVSTNGLGSEVGALGRILTEAALNAMWILQRNDVELSREERERAAEEMSDAAALEAIKVKRIQADRDFGSKEEAARAEKIAEEILAKRNVLKFRLPPIEQIAIAVGKHAHENYDLFYRTNCLDAHPTLVAAIKARQGGDSVGHEMNLFMAVAASLFLMLATYKLMDREEEYGPIDEKVQALLGIRARVTLTA